MYVVTLEAKVACPHTYMLQNGRQGLHDGREHAHVGVVASLVEGHRLLDHADVLLQVLPHLVVVALHRLQLLHLSEAMAWHGRERRGEVNQVSRRACIYMCV
jgi:hypothetical protein